jgi:putative ABC transport system permease protein
MSADRWFRRLLRILPVDFRADYGREMERTFRDQRREAAAGGPARVLALWARSIASLLAIGPREHLSQTWQDARGAWRGMRASPAFTLTAIVTLALGIGANTAMFSVARAVLLRPLPYHDPDRLVRVSNRWDGRPGFALSNPEYLDYSERSRTLDIAASAGGTVILSGTGGASERVGAAQITTNALDVLGVRPARGRPFLPEDEAPGAPCMALLTHGLWVSRYAADPDIVGRTIRIDGEACGIAGVASPALVLPSEFPAESRSAILLPLPLDRADARSRRGGHYLQAFGRLRPGVGLDAARADMEAIITNLKREYPEDHRQTDFGIAVGPLRDTVIGTARPVLMVLLGAVGLVLLLACLNIANLLLARGASRTRELAIRAALGASRLRLARQMLTEAWILSAGGAAAGLAVASGCQRLIAAYAPRALPRSGEVALDGPVLVCAALLAVGAGLVFGLISARQALRAGGMETLKSGARVVEGRLVARRLLVVGQVSIAVVLLVGAGLLVKSFARLISVDSGFRTDHVLTGQVSLPEHRYPGRPEVTAHFARLLEQVSSLPGVESAGAASALPLWSTSGDWSFDVEGRPSVNGRHAGAADWYVVTPGWFETLQIRLVRGRFPAASDSADSQPVILINETTARLFFPGEDPLGRRVMFSRSRGDEQPWRTIVGITADVRQAGLDVPARPEVFFPHAQFQHFVAGGQARTMMLAIRTAADPLSLAHAVREEALRLDPEAPASLVRDMASVVAGSTRDRRLNMILFGSFGGLALLLASVGLYGVLAFQVARRTREMGVRMALGATGRNVAGLVVADGLRLVGWGAAIGIAAAALLAGSMRALLFDVSPHDALIFAAVPLTLLATAILSSWLPARHAVKVDPVTALRAE